MPKLTLMVFCEGQRTEPEYFEALRREPRVRDVASVDIRIDRPGDGAVPLTLVRDAVAERDRIGAEDGEVDEFWCVFDVEWPRNHPHLARAIELANANNIHLAISNPCFEVWLALHFVDCGRWLDNDDSRRLRRQHDGQFDKGLNGNVYMPKIDQAARRAKLLAARHEADGTRFPMTNPSSGMYRIIEAVTFAEKASRE